MQTTMQTTNWSKNFALSPGYVDAKGTRASSMSHDIRRTIPLRRRKLLDTSVTQNDDRVKRDRFETFVKTFGDPFASGGFGKLFRVDFTNDMRRQFRYFLSGNNGSILKVP